MSATNDAGKLLLTPKGEYSGSTTYEIMDAVYYITSTVKGVYVAKGATTGNLPTDTTKWKLLIDLSDFITDATLATSSTVGLVKPDGITDEVDALGVLTALGVVIKAEINTSATEYSATWLKVGTTTLTPSTKQMYRVTESGVEGLYYWNGTAYTKIPTGHTIVNSAGTILPTRSKMKFVNATVTDDSANDQTVITPTGGGSGNIDAAVDLVRDTVGWTGKNRAYSQTNNAVIASIESGKTYSVSWTGSATITLKKDSASGTEITHGSTSPLSFTADSNYSLYFGSSADVTEIMVYDANITDSAFEPYHETVDVMVEEEIHGVNYLDYDLESLKKINTTGTWSNNSYTLNGATLTLNSDKSISLISSGAVSANVIFHLVSKPDLPDGVKLRLSGCPKGGSASSYEMQYGNATNMSYTDRGDGVDNVEKFDYSIYPNSSTFIKVWANANISTAVVFKPMIYKANLKTTFKPYNQQSIQNQINDICENGAVNHAVYPYYDSASVIRGVTWADNNGVLTSSGEVASGSSDSDFFMSRRGTLGPTKLKKGTYRITGCPKGGSPTTYLISCSYLNASNQVVALGADYGDGAIITIDDNAEDRYIQFYCEILPAAGNQTLTWKPMIAPVSYTGGYVPFAMTNRELTEVVTTKILATSAANQTWASQMSTLWAAFSALSYEDRIRCSVFTIVNGNLYQKYQFCTAGEGAFSYQSITGDGLNFQSYSMLLSLQKFYRQNVNVSSGEVTVSDFSSNTNVSALALVIN